MAPAVYNVSIAIIVTAVAAMLWVNTQTEPYAGDALENGVTAKSSVHIDDNWCVPAYYFPHEPLRRDLLLGERAVVSMTPKNLSWQLAAFFEWWSHVSFTIHGHHWTEETIFIPGLQGFGAPKQHKFAADHKTLLNVMDEISAFQPVFLNGSVSAEATHTILAQKWRQLVSLMLDHLAEEEESCTQIIGAGVTEANVDTIVLRILDETPATHLFVELAHFSFWHGRWTRRADGSRHASYDKLRGDIPLPVRVLTSLFYAPRYADQLRLLQSIELGVPFSYDNGAFGGWRGAELLVLAAMASAVTSTVYAVGSMLFACFIGSGERAPRTKKQ